MFGDGSLSLREFASKEPLPLAYVQEALLELLRHRNDIVLIGAQAVNAYVDESRMTQEVDILSTRAEEFAEEVRAYLAKEFAIVLQIRVVTGGKGFRVYQARQPKNRYFAHVRPMKELPPAQIIADIQVLTPDELIAQKIISYSHRVQQPKGGTDSRDLKVLLLAFPQLKSESGPVMDRLLANRANEKALEKWRRLVASQIIVPEEDEGY